MPIAQHRLQDWGIELKSAESWKVALRIGTEKLKSIAEKQYWEVILRSNTEKQYWEAPSAETLEKPGWRRTWEAAKDFLLLLSTSHNPELKGNEQKTSETSKMWFLFSLDLESGDGQPSPPGAFHIHNGRVNEKMIHNQVSYISPRKGSNGTWVFVEMKMKLRKSNRKKGDDFDTSVWPVQKCKLLFICQKTKSWSRIKHLNLTYTKDQLNFTSFHVWYKYKATS